MVEEALQDPDWVLAMQEELNNFKRNEVWSKDSKGTEAVSTIGQMYSFSLKDGFVIDGEPGFVLQPYDQVYVLSLIHILRLLNY